MRVDFADVTAAPLLAGHGLQWFLAGVFVLGVVVTFVLLRTARRPNPNRPAPITHPRLVPRPDDDPDGDTRGPG
ncbi:MAG: hypothetical protein GEV10_21375 [Streptosporangiales bacterium]|nr:hypothetical protein [Streptosporangiales bacterium]